MREIKFRVYSEKDKKFYYISKYVFIYGEDQEFFKKSKLQHLDIWQQYTGLKDKNDTEIYEGDIVKYRCWTNRYEVYGRNSFLKSAVTFKNGEFYPRYINEECEDDFYSYGIDEIEIIGNIYENPELLESKNEI